MSLLCHDDENVKAAVSFVLALYLLYKVRMMAGALAMLRSQAYATDDVPDVLRYGMSEKVWSKRKSKWAMQPSFMSQLSFI